MVGPNVSLVDTRDMHARFPNDSSTLQVCRVRRAGLAWALLYVSASTDDALSVAHHEGRKTMNIPSHPVALYPTTPTRPRGTYANARKAARTSRDIKTGRTFARAPHTGGVIGANGTWRKLSEDEALDRLCDTIYGTGRWARRS